MFDVDFFEVVVIFGVALVVLGPKKLPGLVRSVGRWVGKARSMARQFREQLETEVQLEELNRITDMKTREARAASTPPIPPELAGEPVPPAAPGAAPQGDAAPTADTSLASSGYPYGMPDAGTPAGAAAPHPTDDTYSHAHAAGEQPAPYHPEAPWLNPESTETVAATTPDEATTDTPKPGGTAAG